MRDRKEDCHTGGGVAEGFRVVTWNWAFEKLLFRLQKLVGAQRFPISSPL